MPATPMRMLPASSTTAATATMAKSPCRRATSRNPTPPDMTGKRTAVISSSGSRAVVEHVLLKIVGREHALAA